jgi:uncharacterized membrane protein (DUF485 family)
MDRKALTETFKSFLRFMYFGFLGLIGTYITQFLANTDMENTVVSIGGVLMPVGVVVVTVLAGVVKLIDRYIHTNKNINLNGITPSDLLDR